MSAAPGDVELVRQWVRKAENDLRNAQHTLTLAEDCPYDTVCFHAQQCAEKYLKGLLAWIGVDCPRTHDLRVLFQALSEPATLRLEFGRVLMLNRYSVEARYPGDWEPITAEEASEAVEVAQEVRSAIRRVLPAAALI
ncbi:MAG: HEPN domain-containing protein [Bryobacteraceae bacterium]|jgi:HEPN domain-containing protein